MNLSIDFLWECITTGKIVPYEDELLNNLRNIDYKGIPLSICLLSHKACNGECYTMSINLSRGMDKFTLVHGDVNLFDLNDEYPNHSWVEKDGFVYDTTQGIKWDKELYYSLFKPVVRETYDENSVSNYSLYNDVIERGKQDNPLESSALMVQYLEMLEEEIPTINSKQLFNEANIWRKSHGVNKKYDDGFMDKFKQYMKKYDF